MCVFSDRFDKLTIAGAAQPREQGLRQQISDCFTGRFAGSGGIDSWLGEDTPDTVFERLADIRQAPLTRSELNQLLVLSHEAGLSGAFFHYYWLAAPEHTFDVTQVEPFDSDWIAGTQT